MPTSDKFENRYVIIIAFFVLAALVIVLKAAHLQLIDKTFGKLAISTTIERQVTYPSRGLIYDRNDELLVLNEGIYDIDVIYNNIDPEMDTTLFCELLDIDKETFVKNLDKDWTDIRFAKYAPFTFLTKISKEQFLQFSENLYKFPGFIPQLRNVRGYTHSNAAHVLGYISEVDRKVLQDSSDIYSTGDYIGTSGLELYYEKNLRGTKGLQYILKDKWGNKVSSFDQGKLDSSAVSGDNILISIDLNLQNYLEELMVDKKGAVVAIEPSSGEILAMVNSPSYDPSLLTIHRGRGKVFAELVADTLKPFFERSINAKYPPGSTIKPIMTLIGLQEGLISPTERIYCDGGYTYNNRRWGCHCGGGNRDARSAVLKSCNTYYFRLYRELIDEFGFDKPDVGLDNLNSYFHRMGLGGRLGIDLNNESRGLIPGPEYYDKLYSYQQAKWRSTYIISNGIGQGETEMTTVQLANLAVILANRGWYIKPHFIKQYRNSEKEIPLQYREKIDVGIDKKHFAPVIDGMVDAVKIGTGRTAAVTGIEIAGKTGTSENPHGKDHSVFIAFAPVDNPKIAIAVFVENAGFGSQFAAPISGLAIEQYLRGSISPEKKWLEERMLEADLISP